VFREENPEKDYEIRHKAYEKRVRKTEGFTRVVQRRGPLKRRKNMDKREVATKAVDEDGQ
jgi:hypothetical protein